MTHYILRQAPRAGLIAGLIACSSPHPPPAPALFVEVVRVKSADAPYTFRTSGDIHARVESNLSFRVAGKVVQRLVDVGDRVREGALLARLDSQQQQADVRVAEASVGAAAAKLERTRLELAREGSLFASGATSKASLDNVQGDHADVESSYTSARAQLQLAQEKRTYTELRARRAGTITARSLEVGQVVQEGATVYTLTEDGARDAVFRIDEALANRIRLSTPMAIELVDDPRVRGDGVVREMAPEVDRDTGSVFIKVAIQNPPAAMSLGAPVVGSLKLSAVNTFTIPTAAIVSDLYDAPAVWVVDGVTRKVSLRGIGVAFYESRGVVVREGLREGDLVVTQGANRLRPALVVSFNQVDPA